jgi:hypothetical protein
MMRTLVTDPCTTRDDGVSAITTEFPEAAGMVSASTTQGKVKAANIKRITHKNDFDMLASWTVSISDSYREAEGFLAIPLARWAP